MPPKRFEGKFGIPPSHPVESLLTQALYRLPESVSLEQIEKLTADITNKVNAAREREGGAVLTPEEVQTLHLKLARHYEDNGESAVIDIPTCVDALVESPRFLNSDKGSIEKLFDLHEVKTLQKIAELRRKRAEITQGDTSELNPYENLFETESGHYYLARLLNMPHLEEESAYMDHCVGTSTSYVNKMKRGEVEIFSFRDTTSHEPVVTIEYDTRSHRLVQVKAKSDDIPNLSYAFAPELLEALDRLSETMNDNGEARTIKSNEVTHLNRLLTLQDKIDSKTELTRGDLLFLYEVSEPIQGFDAEREPLIDELREGRNTKEDALVIFDCSPGQIAHNASEITDDTKAYVGALEPDIFNKLPESVEHVYTTFPEGRVKFRSVELGTGIQDGKAFESEIEKRGMTVGFYAKQLLESPDFKVVGTHESADLVELSVETLGFTNTTRYDALCARAQELGLELCPAEVGPQLRLQYTDQPQGGYLRIAMRAISGRDGRPNVFSVHASGDGLWLDTVNGSANSAWDPGPRFVFFRPRKLALGTSDT